MTQYEGHTLPLLDSSVLHRLRAELDDAWRPLATGFAALAAGHVGRTR